MDRLNELTSSLRSRAAVKGRPVTRASLEQRMDELHVPAVSVAVLEGAELQARAWGCETTSLFQAASISKPVAAVGTVRLVFDGVLDLDAKVNSLLTSWQLPDGDEVTVRHLLSHAGALTVHGFPGYEMGTDVPTTTQILDGLPPANTEAVRVDGTPGESFRYSGGGYTILQLLLEDVTGEPFADLMRRCVLDPLSMSSSTYEQPLPEGRRTLAAPGHTADGTPVTGAWHVYPERAAAGLWTSPSELLSVAGEMIDPGAVLDVTARDEMLSPQVDDQRGLGWMLDGAWFQHGGANEGYRCQLFASVEHSRAIAVMTNGDGGGTLCAEVVAAAAEVFDWPDYLREREAIDLDAAALDAVAGDYEIQPGVDLVIRRDGSRLLSSIPGAFAEDELFAASPTEFFRVDFDGTLVLSEDGSEITLSGANITAKRKPT